jgi:hypothetical protein
MSSINYVIGNPVEANRRMVVFVPEMLENVAEFTRQVYNQAAAQQRKILYLAVSRRETDQLAATRQLATIVALTQGSAINASAAHVNLEDPAKALRESTRPGDLVIWPQEDWLAPASLEHELGITQQALHGIHIYSEPQASPWYRPVLFWAAALALLAVFSYLEFSAGRLLSGAPLKVALILLFSLELGAFYQWDRLFR